MKAWKSTMEHSSKALFTISVVMAIMFYRSRLELKITELYMSDNV